LAASLAGKIAADLGARVIKVEPPGGDPTRTKPPFLRENSEMPRSALFAFLNAGKTLLRAPSDLAAARASLETLLSKRVDAALVEDGDEVIQSVAERGIAHVEIAAWPATMSPGPQLSEFTALALGGLLDMVGDPSRQPLRLGGHQASYSAGLSAFSALAAVLAERDRGRTPPPARVSLIETVMWVNWKAVAGVDSGGKAPSREGDRSDFQVLRCADGWVAVVFTAGQFESLRALVGSTELRDAKFSTREGRRKYVRELYANLAPWFASRTREQIYMEAQARGVPLGPVYEPRELRNDPQNRAREFTVPFADPIGGLYGPRLPLLWNGRSFAPISGATANIDEVLQ
jgi:crotonobetainyl-CoA:carnitine CoA-transferase CaiB-like acyl-CoA transferase